MNAIQQLNDIIKREAGAFLEVAKETNRVIVGQDRLINRLLIGLLCGGHILIEGVPGLAKTLAVRTLASTVQAKFQRIQFTPDLLPSDLIGTQIYSPRTGEFAPRLGPIFANIILADEINRAPAKVQSALLEAMEERQVTVGDQTHALPVPFMVLATQNPIEQEGTYLLPEAQLDRFMLKVIVGYPTRAEERLIVGRMTSDDEPTAQPVIDLNTVQQARSVVNGIYVDEKIHDYVLNIIFMTRDPVGGGAKELGSLIEYGASPRATISLLKAAKAFAFLRGRGYVTPDDVKQVAPDVLRHRILVTFEAQAEDVTSEQVIEQILRRVPVP
ncbi:MAG: AAA domain-containing protein [Anaerolineaceae bacterium]|nr:AAA domain-containing protein [Anaerolineaceae bacterium]